MILRTIGIMRRTKVTEPVTDNAERAQRENRRQTQPPDRGTGGPSRAHSYDAKTRHEKKPGRTAPKSGR